MNTFPYAKAIALASLYPNELFMCEVNDEPTVALGIYFLDHVSHTDTLTNFRKVT